MSRKRRQKLPIDPVMATIESLSHDGRGVAHIDGKAIFIDGALPGEEVEFIYTSRKRTFDEGKVHNVISASPHRVVPACAHYGICGGCSLQHLDPDEQIKQKQSILLDNLKHIGHVTPETVLEPVRGPVWGYRRKARLGVKYVIKKERVLVGFREKRNSFIADIAQCEVMHPSVGKKIASLAELINQSKIRDKIPQIEVAISDDSTALIIRHLVDMPAEDKEKWALYAQQNDFMIFLQPGGLDSVAPLLAEQTPEKTQLHYTVPDYNIEMAFQPTQFTQVNADINRKMIDLAVRSLAPQPADNIIDFFCGLGNFTLPIARSGAAVVGVEGSDELVQLARHNAKINKIDNVEFYKSDLFGEFEQSQWAKQKYNKVLLDPPRSGALNVVQWLPKTGVEKIVYISCNPSTLARDADVLVNTHGFKLTQTGAMDMFPHTGHVEAIAIFEI